jgi:hypothetical protein
MKLKYLPGFDNWPEVEKIAPTLIYPLCKFVYKYAGEKLGQDLIPKFKDLTIFVDED